MHKYAVGQKVKILQPLNGYKDSPELAPYVGAVTQIRKVSMHPRTKEVGYRVDITRSDGYYMGVVERRLAPIDDSATRFIAGLTTAPRKEPQNA